MLNGSPQVMRETLWHGDTDSNVALGSDYALLATWPDSLKRARLDRVPNRWAAALLSRLLMRSPAARPATMHQVLRHPFFETNAAHVAPPLAEGEENHFFLRRGAPSARVTVSRCRCCCGADTNPRALLPGLPDNLEATRLHLICFSARHTLQPFPGQRRPPLHGAEVCSQRSGTGCEDLV